MKITDYGIVEGISAQELRQRVLTYLQGGWEPQGGVTVSQNPVTGKTVYAQAIVRSGEQGA